MYQPSVWWDLEALETELAEVSLWLRGYDFNVYGVAFTCLVLRLQKYDPWQMNI
jgi:hypothetical protein